MRKLQRVKAVEDFTLVCTFENGVQKIADVKPYLQSEVFKPLLDVAVFNQVVNRDYYVSWLNEEVDLSADTLWHIGVDVSPSLVAQQ
jgi:hypothetical protein